MNRGEMKNLMYHGDFFGKNARKYVEVYGSTTG
jgi:hypothetical protein